MPCSRIAVGALVRICRLCWQDWIDQPSFCFGDVLSRVKLRVYRGTFRRTVVSRLLGVPVFGSVIGHYPHELVSFSDSTGLRDGETELLVQRIYKLLPAFYEVIQFSAIDGIDPQL